MFSVLRTVKVLDDTDVLLQTASVSWLAWFFHFFTSHHTSPSVHSHIHIHIYTQACMLIDITKGTHIDTIINRCVMDCLLLAYGQHAWDGNNKHWNFFLLDSTTWITIGSGVQRLHRKKNWRWEWSLQMCQVLSI